jgi:hypothetical protein
MAKYKEREIPLQKHSFISTLKYTPFHCFLSHVVINSSQRYKSLATANVFLPG